MKERVHIFVDQDAVKPVTTDKPRITVCNVAGEELLRTKKLILRGNWVLRQYNNPVPCGASIVLYPLDDNFSYGLEESDDKRTGGSVEVSPDV